MRTYISAIFLLFFVNGCGDYFKGPRGQAGEDGQNGKDGKVSEDIIGYTRFYEVATTRGSNGGFGCSARYETYDLTLLEREGLGIKVSFRGTTDGPFEVYFNDQKTEFSFFDISLERVGIANIPLEMTGNLISCQIRLFADRPNEFPSRMYMTTASSQEYKIKDDGSLELLGPIGSGTRL